MRAASLRLRLVPGADRVCELKPPPPVGYAHAVEERARRVERWPHIEQRARDGARAGRLRRRLRLRLSAGRARARCCVGLRGGGGGGLRGRRRQGASVVEVDDIAHLTPAAVHEPVVAVERAHEPVHKNDETGVAQ